MANVFNTVMVKKPSKSRFDHSHDFKFTQQFGKLTPILCKEVLPGDSWRISTESLIRFAPMVNPVMHSIKLFTHYFFVPARLCMSNDTWQAFISSDLSKETPPAWPYITMYVNSNNSLADYLGVPTGSWPQGVQVSALPFSAYQFIYNEYYRDQNLIEEVDYIASPGDNESNEELLGMRTRAWKHDYFTAALPFAQKGPAVSLPLGDSAPVHRNSSGTAFPLASWSLDAPTGDVYVNQRLNDNPDVHEQGLYADLTEATASTINDLRVAFRLQEFFEKAARGGTRYIEQLKVHFNVSSSDKRMQRPEFLGGSINPVVISEVLQTSSSDTETPQGNMAGHAIGGGRGKQISYYAEEHGFIIGIQSVMPTPAYMQGLDKMWTRTTWQDYAWPTFAHLGEQAVLNKELYLDPSDGLDNDTFGYIPRYSEYRYSASRVSGEFRTTLDKWHMARKFGNRPNLNQDFIECKPRNDIFAVTEEDNQNLWCHCYHSISVVRALPKYGTPTL